MLVLALYNQNGTPLSTRKNPLKSSNKMRLKSTLSKKKDENLCT